MTAPATILHLVAGVGIDQSTRAEHVQPGQSNLYTENARINQTGELVKRYGFSQFTNNRLGSGTRSAAHRLAALGKSVVASDGSVLDVYSPAAVEWSPRGRVTECTAKRFGVAACTTSNTTLYPVEYGDIAYGNGYYVLVATDFVQTLNIKVMVYVVDATTKKVVYSAQAGSGTTITSYSPRVVVVGTTAVVVWTVSNTIRASTLDLTSLSSGLTSPTDLATNYNNDVFDVSGMTSTFALGYGNSGGGTTRITLKTFAPASLGSAAATQTETTTSAAITALCICATAGEELWTAWAHSGSANVYVSARNPSTLGSTIASSTLTTTSSSGASNISVGRSAANTVYVWATSADSNFSSSEFRASTAVRARNNSGSLVTDRNVAYIPGWAPASRPFVVNSRVYMELHDDRSLAGTVRNVVLADVTLDVSVTTIRPVAWVAPRLSLTYPIGNPRHVAAVSSTFVATAHTVVSAQRSLNLSVAEYDFAGQRHHPLNYAGKLYLTGGIFSVFDSDRVFEDGFVSPAAIQVGTSGTGITGTFSYTTVDEYTDANGDIVWGPPSPVVSTGAITNKQVDLVIRRNPVTWKNGLDSDTDYPPQNLRAVRSLLFRTENAGATFYLVAISAVSPTSAVWSVTDTTSDATLITRPSLYKAPGAVAAAKDRQALGAVQHACECNGVLVVVDDTCTTLRAFAERTVGEAPWHHDNLQLPIDGDGEITALASLDGSVIAFKRDAIYVVPVEPANANLTQGGFGYPRRIAVDAGCVDPRSVLVTSMGVFFQSDRGIELLTRSLSVEPIGDLIQDTYASYPNVVSATLDVKNGLARFSLAQTGSSTVGLVAVFDLTRGAWVTFDKMTGAAASAQAISSTYAFHSSSWRYMWIESDGTVHYEDTSTYLDKSSSWVALKWETPWIKLELQREHQFWQGILLHERKTACGLLGEMAEDWADYDSGDNKTWNEAAITTYTRQVELRWTKRGQSFKCRFSDSAPAVVGTGQGLEFVGLSFDLAPHQGPTQGTPRLAVAARR